VLKSSSPSKGLIIHDGVGKNGELDGLKLLEMVPSPQLSSIPIHVSNNDQGGWGVWGEGTFDLTALELSASSVKTSRRGLLE
jgi:hypothetical protein